MDFETLPDGWDELTYDTGPDRGSGPYTEELDALWVHESEQVRLTASHSTDATGLFYSLIVEQICEDPETEITAEIVSHSRVAEDRREVESQAVTFMQEMNDGKHRLRVLDVQIPDDHDFVQWYTICDSELPETLTAAELIEAIDTDGTDHDVSQLEAVQDELPDDQHIQVDVYPTLKDEHDQEL